MYHTVILRVDYQIFLTSLSSEIPPILASHSDNFLGLTLLHSQDLSRQAYPTIFVLTLPHESSPVLHDAPNLALHVRGQNSQ
jgi:hypothetical protein